ncbi:Hypothetical predicted protein, partial [Paramuricea clavata]
VYTQSKQGVSRSQNNRRSGLRVCKSSPDKSEAGGMHSAGTDNNLSDKDDGQRRQASVKSTESTPHAREPKALRSSGEDKRTGSRKS